MAISRDSLRQSPRRGGQEPNLVLVRPATGEDPTATPAIRVLVAHGDRLARAGLGSLLAEEPDLAMVGAAADGSEALALVGELRPDVLLIDMALDGMDAVEVTRQIFAGTDSRPVRVLVLGTSEGDDWIFSCLRAGASGFLIKDAEPTELMQGIRAVAAGDAALSPAGARRLIAQLATQPDPRQASPELLEELTARECEVLALVAGGLSNDEIARQLVVTPATAKTHVSRIMIKLHAHHRAQLVTLAYETGLVKPRHPVSATGGASSASLALA